jgi:hypothetical protein
MTAHCTARFVAALLALALAPFRAVGSTMGHELSFEEQSLHIFPVGRRPCNAVASRAGTESALGESYVWGDSIANLVHTSVLQQAVANKTARFGLPAQSLLHPKLPQLIHQQVVRHED